MRIVNGPIHAYLDYPFAVAVIVVPSVLGLGGSYPAVLRLSPLIGATAFLLTIFTDHHLGILGVMSCRFRLSVDLPVGALFLFCPSPSAFPGSLPPTTGRMMQP